MKNVNVTQLHNLLRFSHIGPREKAGCSISFGIQDVKSERRQKEPEMHPEKPRRGSKAEKHTKKTEIVKKNDPL